MSAWHAIDIPLPDATEEQLDIFSATLFEVGAQGIETKDSPQLLVATFPPDLDTSEIVPLLVQSLEAQGLSHGPLQVRALEPVDWATHWRHHFHPLQFGKLWVVPSWLEPPEGAEHVLWIDPSMAFGTGLHATTALCLERIVALSPVASILDVGTGTGILAMGAQLLGAQTAVGIDNDPDAITVAQENAAKNALPTQLSTDDVTTLTATFPLVVANILAQPLIELAPAIAARVAPGGTLLLSGVLGTQADDVVKAYLAQGLTQPVVTPREEWVRIELIR